MHFLGMKIVNDRVEFSSQASNSKLTSYPLIPELVIAFIVWVPIISFLMINNIVTEQCVTIFY
jgi:hypothetical protein